MEIIGAMISDQKCLKFGTPFHHNCVGARSIWTCRLMRCFLNAIPLNSNASACFVLTNIWLRFINQQGNFSLYIYIYEWNYENHHVMICIGNRVNGHAPSLTRGTKQRLISLEMSKQRCLTRWVVLVDVWYPQTNNIIQSINSSAWASFSCRTCKFRSRANGCHNNPIAFKFDRLF